MGAPIKMCVACGVNPTCTQHFLSQYCSGCNRAKRLLYTKVHACNHRAKKFNTQGVITIQDWMELCDRYGKKCLRCGKPGDYHSLTPDHVVSMSIGGTNTIDNIQPFCFVCNSVKSTKTTDYRQLDCEPCDLIKRIPSPTA